jgi:hypothetical protein
MARWRGHSIRVARLLSILTGLISLASSAIARPDASCNLVFFLDEKVPLVAEDSKVPSEALPDLSLRGNLDSKGLFLVFDCDTRNLNLPETTAAPYTLGITFGAPGSEPVTIAINGSRSATEVELPVVAMVGAATPPPVLPAGWEKLVARQTKRDDGTCRVTLLVPRDLLEKNKWVDAVPVQVNWRQLTGQSDAGEPQYLASGGMVLALPFQSASFSLRPATPSDIAMMLAVLANAPDSRCADRSIRRLCWLGRKDEALRGALVMALEHADPALRAAAAKVWLEWSAPDTPGLAELKAKAKLILSAPAN